MKIVRTEYLARQNHFVRLCECGCGQQVKNRFVHVSHVNRTEWKRSQQKEMMTGRPSPFKGRKLSQEQLAKRIKIPEIEFRISYCKCGCGQSFVSNRNWKYNKGRIQHYINGHNTKGKKHTEEWNKKISVGNKGKTRLIGYKQAPEHVLRRFENGKLKPNRLETRLQKILDKYYPGQYEYNYDSVTDKPRISIDGLIPDFISLTGRKKVIEAFGTYWHRDDDLQAKIDRYYKSGYECLILWENDIMNNTSELLRQLEDFIGKDCTK